MTAEIQDRDWNWDFFLIWVSVEGVSWLIGWTTGIHPGVIVTILTAILGLIAVILLTKYERETGRMLLKTFIMAGITIGLISWITGIHYGNIVHFVGLALSIWFAKQ